MYPVTRNAGKVCRSEDGDLKKQGNQKGCRGHHSLAISITLRAFVVIKRANVVHGRKDVTVNGNTE